MVRPILNKWHPQTSKVTYWFPTFFCLAFISAITLWVFNVSMPIFLFACYYVLIFIDSLIKNKSIAIALLSLLAVSIQFIGYGYGFLKATLMMNFSKKKPELLFPQLFFKRSE